VPASASQELTVTDIEFAELMSGSTWQALLSALRFASRSHENIQSSGTHQVLVGSFRARLGNQTAANHQQFHGRLL